MPTYEYACEACGHKFEEFQSITSKPITKCPVCKKNKVKRLISAGAGFIFKGSGFYITDYRSDNYKAGEKSAASAAEGTKSEGAKTETKADAGKPAEKAPAKTETKAESKPAAAPAKSAPAKSSKK